MRINKNVKSIARASAAFAKQRFPVQNKYYFDTALVSMDTSKNLFSIVYLESISQDDDEDDSLVYQRCSTEYFNLEYSDLLSIVSFHVSLVLPKESRSGCRAVAREVIKAMKHSHAYYYVGWYGHSKAYYQYSMPIDSFIHAVMAQVIPTDVTVVQ